jgi:hypothetical protein
LRFGLKKTPKLLIRLAEEDILNLVTGNTLLLLDRGFYHFNFWQKLMAKKAG